MPTLEKKWLEVHCVTPGNSEETVSDILISLGATGTWSETGAKPGFMSVYAYFKDTNQNSPILSALSLALAKNSLSPNSYELSGKLIGEIDWQAEWKKHHKPVKVGKSIRIIPAWWENSFPEDTVIRIDPGMAFGAGGHPTTRLCLRAMEKILQETKETKDFSIMDLGCGSGILAIAGLKLGATETVGVDNDPVALENARRNSELNGVSVTYLSQIPIKKKFDLIVSNIYAETHLELLEAMLEALNVGGRMILSGILNTKKEMVFEAFTGSGLKLVREKNEGEWVCLVFGDGKGRFSE